MKSTTGRSPKKRHTVKRHLKTVEKGETLKVRLRDNCEPDYDWVNLRKKVGDQIRWVSLGKEFTIHFEATPFADEHGNAQHDFPVPANGSVDSGPPVLGKPGEEFEYTVVCEALAMSADPGLSVKE
jgi:hypothetical protein